MGEYARLEIVCTLIAYPGFEPRTLRYPQLWVSLRKRVRIGPGRVFAPQK